MNAHHTYPSRSPIVLVGLTLAGCVLYDPANLEHATRDDGSVSSDSGSVDPGCELRHAPDRPPQNSDDIGVPDYFFAIRRMQLKQLAAEEWREIGYDLDGICSGPPSYRSECTNIDAIATDGSGGIDNVFGAQLFPLFENVVEDFEAPMRAMQDEGRNSLVLILRGWNRQLDDSRVTAIVATSVGTTSSRGADDNTPPPLHFDRQGRPLLADGSPAEPPRWDGTDFTVLRNDSFIAGSEDRLDRAKVSSTLAYVRDGVLVLPLPAREFLLFSTDVRASRAGELLAAQILLSGGIMSARIDPATLVLSEGLFAGRWAVNDNFYTAEQLGLCPEDSRAAFLMDRLPRMADVLTEPPETGETLLPCDALSLGVRFMGTPVRHHVELGYAEGPSVPNVCAELRSLDAGVPMSSDAGDPASTDAGGNAMTRSLDDAGATDDSGTIDTSAISVGDAGSQDSGGHQTVL